MKKSEAVKVAKIVRDELKKRNYLCPPRVVVEEGTAIGGSKGNWGILVYTDGDSYEELYDIFLPYGLFFGYNPFTFLKKIERKINEEMGWREEEHYFEAYGQGILFMF